LDCSAAVLAQLSGEEVVQVQAEIFSPWPAILINFKRKSCCTSMLPSLEVVPGRVAGRSNSPFSMKMILGVMSMIRVLRLA
jgi:hypothetical protein